MSLSYDSSQPYDDPGTYDGPDSFTIFQTSPLVDSTVSGLSINYTNQLNAVGGNGQLLWETTVPSTSITVFPDGSVGTTGSLNDGTYAISGVVSDDYGNQGTWVFSLTVTGPYSPGTTVTPYDAALPTGVQISVPFQIDPATGAVAVTSNFYTIIQQHVLSIIMTTLGERVMLPTYGASLESQVFAPMSGAEFALISRDISSQIAAWEPNAQVQAVNVTQVPGSDSSIAVVVQYFVVPFNSPGLLAVNVGGGVFQVVSS